MQNRNPLSEAWLIPQKMKSDFVDGLLKMEKYAFGLSRKGVLELVGWCLRIKSKFHVKIEALVRTCSLISQDGIIYQLRNRKQWKLSVKIAIHLQLMPVLYF